MAEVDTLLFTSKSVNEGHPDKLCDQISDTVLDACLEQDLDINVTNETCTRTNMDVGENPEIGMMFETLEIAYNYYNSYARRIGFSVRKKRTNKTKYDPNIIDSQTLCCSCEGSYKKNRTPQKRRENRRFECKAEFHLNRVNDRFRLSRFTAEHTHELATSEQAHYLRSQRKIQCSQVGLIGKMHSSGISQSNIFSYLSEEAGGAELLNFIRYDCYNLVQRKRNEFLKKGDVQCLQEWFKQKTRENKYFFYSLWANDDGVVKGIFFCDGKSRRDYGLFGDVICFDTTFNTNNYNMVCAPLVGVNNHGQTTIFGCGLLEGETTDAIVWLFTVFLEAMGGKKPQTIFTDQSAAIAKAIEQIFPEAHHRLCLWHIYQNAAKHLAKSFSEFKSLAKRFKQCIYEPETVAEFEESWEKMLDDHGLKDNDWLQRLFQFRHKWAQVYAHTYFCAGMTTTQRSESINKFLKDYFSTTMIIREFVDQYSKAMTNRREKENMEENRTSQTTPILLSNWDVELEASKIYTKKIFYLFQEEYKKILDLDFKLEDDDGFVCTYTVLELNGRRRNRTLTYHKSEKTILCSCKKFEFHGVLCSHALSLFRRLDFTSLPEKYYLKRWTRAIKDEVVLDPFGEAIPNDIDPLATIRYSELSHLSQRIVAKGAKSSIKCSFAKKYLLELEEKLDSVSDEEQGNTSRNVPILHENVNADEQLRDPKSKRCRGQPKARRKSALETRTRKSNVSSKRMRDMGQNLITAQTREIIQTADGALNLYQPTQGSVNVVIRPEVQQWRTIYPFQPCTTPTPSAPTQESQGLPRRLLYSDTSTYSTDP